MVSKAKPERPSLKAVAERRFRLAGRTILEQGHPYGHPVDQLAATYGGQNGGFLSFAQYDYLGLQRHPEVIDAAQSALETFGSGSGASRIVGGERSGHRTLEAALARFLGVEDVVTIISGYLTNLSLINHLLGPRDLVLIDEFAHNSIVVGAKSGRFACQTFGHNDLDDLERQLSAARDQYRHVLIVVEGLYSMDGDIPDLPRLIEIKRRHDAWLLVDEAHSYGVLGPTGRGLCDYYGVAPSEIDLSVGTLSKSFVSSGGFIAAAAEIVAWLRFTLPGFVYSVGLSPATAASAQAAVTILEREPDRVARLKARSRLFRDAARAAGLNPGRAIGEAVVPLFFESGEQTMLVSQELLSQGIYAPPIIQVGVPRDQPRIRFFFSANHSEADILRTIDIIAETVHGTEAIKAAAPLR